MLNDLAQAFVQCGHYSCFVVPEPGQAPSQQPLFGKGNVPVTHKDHCGLLARYLDCQQQAPKQFFSRKEEAGANDESRTFKAGGTLLPLLRVRSLSGTR